MLLSKRVFGEGQLIRQSKKGQAALEFLTTYGWALMAILAVIGGMTYFMGAGDVEDAVPERCALGTDFHCESSAVDSTGRVFLEMRSTSVELNVSRIRCIYPDGSNVTEDFSDMILSPNTLSTVKACGGKDDLEMSGKEKVIVKMVYSETESGSFKHVAQGDIVQNIYSEDDFDSSVEDNLEGGDDEDYYDYTYDGDDGYSPTSSEDEGSGSEEEPVDNSCWYGNDCDSSELCVGGTCESSCEGNYGEYVSNADYNYSEDSGNDMMCCDGKKVDTSGNDKHCGYCDTVCSDNEECVGGSCEKKSCSSGNDCEEGICVEGNCQSSCSDDGARCSDKSYGYDSSSTGLCIDSDCVTEEIIRYGDGFHTECYEVTPKDVSYHEPVSCAVSIDGSGSSPYYSPNGICAKEEGKPESESVNCVSGEVYIDNDEALRKSCYSLDAFDELVVCDRDTSDGSFNFDGACTPEGCARSICKSDGGYNPAVTNYCDSGTSCDREIIDSNEAYDNQRFKPDGIVVEETGCYSEAVCRVDSEDAYFKSSSEYCRQGTSCDSDVSDGSFKVEGVIGVEHMCLTGMVCENQEGTLYEEIPECGMGALCDPDVGDGSFTPEGILDVEGNCETEIACKEDLEDENIIPEDGCDEGMVCDDDLSDGFDKEPVKRYTEYGECVDEELL
ncbi:MAG: hypothetical protein ACOCZV_01005 [Nanoarchaeota archaeon]